MAVRAYGHNLVQSRLVDERIADNQKMWDERVPLHVRSDFYDVDGFKAGRSSLQPFEVEEVGDVTGKTLVHLQCHFGLDTLSWARLGALVTGLDFSPTAVKAATQLAAETGLATTANFVCADVYDAPAALQKRAYDIVYTGHGALIWLPDIDRWAWTVRSLLKPGGRLYLAEFHPIVDALGWGDELTFESGYFHDPAGEFDESPGSYVDLTAPTTNNRSHEWRHPIGDVISALSDYGLTIDFLHERPITLWQRWPFLVEHDDGTFRLPPDKPKIPLSYSLRATAPTAA